MFTLTDTLPSTVKFKGEEYHVDLSFDNILRLYDMLEDDEIESYDKIDVALEMFFYDYESMEFSDIQEQLSLYKYVMKEFLEIDIDEANKKENDDNTETMSDNVGKKVYDYKKDAKLIYASFLRYYKIDLHDELGKLDYRKFTLLLSELDDESPFKKAVKYRTIKIPKLDNHNKEYVQNLKKLKQYYSLEDNSEVPEEKAIQNVNKGFDEIAKVFMKNAKKE